MKKLMTSIMALAVLTTGSAQAWCEPDYCYNPCSPCDPCAIDEGFYIGGYGGANWVSSDRKYRYFDDAGAEHHTRLKFDTGYVVAASIGYRWCNNFRGEFEYSYRHNKLKRAHIENVVVLDGDNRVSGKFWSNSYLVNAYYDFDFCNDWCLKPYVGVGIGYATQHISVSRNETVIAREEGLNSASAKKNGFAWQVLAGVSYAICDNLDLFVDYRFNHGRVDHIYNQNVGAGLRYFF